MKNLLVVLFMGLFLSVILTSCGGPTKSSGPSGPGAPSTSIDVTMDGMNFSPDTFTVPAGEQITFTAKNIDTASDTGVHSFVIMKAGFQVTGMFTYADSSYIYWKGGPILFGKSLKDSFTSPSEPGEYQIVSDVPGQFQYGMVGKLFVVKQP